MNRKEAIIKLDRIEREAIELRDELSEIINESEKPKLRHGDWWFDEDDKDTNIFLKEFNTDERDCVAHSENLFTNIGSNYEGQPILGNIFDLMKGWSEDLTEFEVAGDCQVLNGQITSNNKDIWLKISSGSTVFTLAKAKEIWHKLGQVIATLKRKENK